MPPTGPIPPRFTSWLLSRMSGYQSQFFWLGDLEEEYAERVTDQGALICAIHWYGA